MSLKSQSGIFGTALRLTKVTSMDLFPGPEARFVGQDFERDPVILIDPQGMLLLVQVAGLHQIHKQCRSQCMSSQKVQYAVYQHKPAVQPS